MIGTVVDYGAGWLNVLSGERLFYISTDAESVRMGQDYEFDPGEKKYIKSKEYYNGAYACKHFKKREEVREVAEKKKTIEQKTCPHWKGSSGAAMPSMYIKCQDRQINFQSQSEDEFNQQFDICNHHPEDCKIIKDRDLLSKIIGKEIRTHYNTGGIVTSISGPYYDKSRKAPYSIIYTKDGKESKSPSFLNTINVKDGVITCEGKPLQIVGEEDKHLCELLEKVDVKEPDSAESCANCSADKKSCQPYQACMSEQLEPNECVCENWTGVQTIKTCKDCGLFGENKPNRHTDTTHECLHVYSTGRTGTTLPENPACEHFIKKGETNLIPENQICIKAQEDCPYYCDHNKGCTLLIVAKKIIPDIMNQAGEVDCDVYKNAVNEQKTTENDAFLLKNVQKTNEIVTFDYSSVDEETGMFLQEKANRIIEVRIKSVMAIGKELKEAQEKLANHDKYQGTFGQWYKSLGFTKDTVYRNINAYEYVVANCEDITLAEKIQPSLLFAISKPSASPELQEAVLTGDIKTHKEYKEMEQKLKDAEFHYETVQNSYKRLEKVNSEHYKLRTIAEDQVKELKNQLRQANSSSDIEKIKELDQSIHEKQQEIEDLRQQLRDKPIEATASTVIEKIPENIEITQYHLKNYAKVNTVLEMVENLTTEEMQSWAKMMNDRQAVNDDDESCWLEVLTTALQNLQDMEDDYRQGGYGS